MKHTREPKTLAKGGGYCGRLGFWSEPPMCRTSWNREETTSAIKTGDIPPGMYVSKSWKAGFHGNEEVNRVGSDARFSKDVVDIFEIIDIFRKESFDVLHPFGRAENLDSEIHFHPPGGGVR